jgi:ankyrin repeat protein
MRRLFRDNDFTTRPEQGNTPLILAAGDLDAEDVDRLIEQGADVNATNVHKQTALGWVSDFAHDDMDNAMKIVDLLLDHGADINAQDTNGDTALMKAGYKGNLVLLRRLLERGADPNLRRNDGSAEGATMLGFMESIATYRSRRRRVIKIVEAAGGTR